VAAMTMLWMTGVIDEILAAQDENNYKLKNLSRALLLNHA
jgi:hypothetical protein